MNPPPDDLQNKLNHLRDYLDELQYWLSESRDALPRKATGRIFERMVQIIVECAADAGDLWLQEMGYTPGESVRGVFRQLHSAGLLDDEAIERFAMYVSLRNRIIHDYEDITFDVLTNTVPRILDDCSVLLQKMVRT